MISTTRACGSARAAMMARAPLPAAAAAAAHSGARRHPRRRPLAAPPSFSRDGEEDDGADTAKKTAADQLQREQQQKHAGPISASLPSIGGDVDPKKQLQQPQPQPPAAAPAALSSADGAALAPYAPGFVARRWFVFAGLVVGYLSLYLSRLTLTYAAPVMVADPSLGLTKADIGVMASAFPAAYGLSKFASGMLGAAFSPRLMLAVGVAVTAAINLVFGATSSVALWTALWALNGALQGAGAPACAMLLSRWYPPRERGTYWGLWNCLGSNFGGFITPLLVGTVAAAAGWRAGFFVPGAFGLGVGAALLWALADDPTRLGFPPADPAEALRAREAADEEERAHGAAVAAARQERRDKRRSAAAAAAAAGAGSGAAPATASGDESEPEEEETPEARRRRGKRAALAASMAEVVRSKGIWLLALAYFFVYVVRQGATSWLVFYLLEEKGVADAGTAAARVSGLELGGLLGGTLAGVASDRAISAAKARHHAHGHHPPAGAAAGAAADAHEEEEEEGLVGKRVRVTMAYAAATLAVLAALRAIPPGAPPAALWLVIAALGFCIYGPQMLIGLCGAELVTPASVGASQGVLGLVSYMGAANAGAPLARLQAAFGWEGYFAAMAGASVAAVALLAPLANAKSRVQRDRAAAARAAGAA